MNFVSNAQFYGLLFRGVLFRGSLGTVDTEDDGWCGAESRILCLCEFLELAEEHCYLQQYCTVVKKPSEQLKNKFKTVFSNTLPKSLIFRSVEYMLVSPYLFESSSRALTLIIENLRSVSFYNHYQRYIKRLIEQSLEYDNL